MIGIKPEIVQGTPANRVGVLVLCKRFRVPGYGIDHLSNSPWCVAITLVVKGAIICPTGFLGWRMKTDVADVHSGCEGHAKRLDSAIKILVIQGILIVPDPSSGIRHFVPHKPNTIVTRVRRDLVYYRRRPSHDGRLHPHR